MSTAFRLVEAGIVPDRVVRYGIRRLCARRLREQERLGPSGDEDWVAEMGRSPLAIATEDANEQHYEVPADFFRLVLGPHLKYSSGWWDEGTTDLARAEAEMLARTADRAGLADGQQVLDLGCGWGSLTLWAAERFPASRFVAVSNSASQRAFIEAECRRRGLGNVEVITADVNVFAPGRRFDRVVSVEMFEHVRNWPTAFSRVADWLEDDGRFFMHVFCHREHAYPFEDAASDDWMARTFFTGGHMPSFELPRRFDSHLTVEQSWNVAGTHYAATAEAWLANLDERRDEVLPVLRATYGEAEVWHQRWRVFFMPCAELFGWDHGREWHVAHHLLARR